MVEYYSVIKRMSNNMDVPQGHYAKWNKSDIERQISYDPTCMRNLKKKKKKKRKVKNKNPAHRYREQIGEYEKRGMGKMGKLFV